MAGVQDEPAEGGGGGGVMSLDELMRIHSQGETVEADESRRISFREEETQEFQKDSDEEVLRPSKRNPGKQTTKLTLTEDRMGALTAEERKSFYGMNPGPEGQISFKDVANFVRQSVQKKEHYRTMKMLFCGVVLVLIILLIGNMAITFAVVEMTKEDHVTDGVLVGASTGEPVKTSSADIAVGSGGVLTSRQCLTESCDATLNASETPVAVMENKVQREISSVIPGKLLAQLKQIKLVAQDGVSELYLNVQGVMRVVTPGSRCGTVVKFFTQIGVVTFDDTIASVDPDSEASRILNSAGFELAQDGAVGFGGRRLSGAVNALGYFNFFENYDWQCDSLPAPKFFTKPYMVSGKQVHPCFSDKCLSNYRDANGDMVRKPGVLEDDSAIESQYEEIANDTHTVRLTRVPNHPDWTFVEITDWAQRIHRSYQLGPDGNAWYCDIKSGDEFEGTDLDMSKSFTVVFNGYSAKNSSLREFTLVPIDEEKVPVIVGYVDEATTFLPKMISFRDAAENEFDTQTVTIDAHDALSTSGANALMRMHIEKACLSNADAMSSNVSMPVQMIDDPYFEDKAAVLSHISYIDDEMEMDTDYIQAVEAKYGSYWATLVEQWVEDPEYLNSGSFDSESLDPESLDDDGRRLSELEEELEEVPVEQEDKSLDLALMPQQESSYMSPSLPIHDNISRRLGVSFKAKIRLDNKCVVKLNLKGNAKELCGDISTDNTCGRQAPGWYATGQINGCVSPGRASISGEVCAGYYWGVKKGFSLKVGPWRKRINIECGVTLYGCFRVNSDAIDVGRRRGNRRRKGGRRRRRDWRNQVTFILRGGIAGGCGAAGIKVSAKGEIKFAAGPCGSGLDMRLKAALTLKGCIKVGPFKGCLGFPTINLVNEDLPNC